MLDAWLKSKFYAKSKSTIRHTNLRIVMVKRKRNAMLKYLKNDIADLLKTGLDVNAYSRAEGLLVELNLSRCYDFLEQYSEYITNNLSVMYKQRECPEECREAVASLIFAAARFADVPELRELRSVFTERYGNFLECYVRKDFLQNLKPGPPTKEMKLQLMKDIASEFGIKWNSKALEQKLFNPLILEHDWWTKSRNDQKHHLHSKMEQSPQKKDSEVAKFNCGDTRQLTISKDKLEHNSCHGRKVSPDDEHPSPMRRTRNSLNRKSNDTPPVKDIEVDSTDIERQQNKPEIELVAEEESDVKKPLPYRSILPPYIKSISSLTNNPSDASPTSSTGEENCKDDTGENIKNKPRSARTRRGPKATISDDKEPRDEEEKVMDRLLMYLSRKKFQNSVNTPKKATVDSPSEVSRRRSMGNKSTSLPAEGEQTSPGELNRAHVRANSFQPDMLGPNGHAHPKLPHYDDFVARLAFLREQSRE
ncbi:unnamed protein product [Withania somnifera]